MDNFLVWLCAIGVIYFTVRWAIQDQRKADARKRPELDQEDDD